MPLNRLLYRGQFFGAMIRRARLVLAAVENRQRDRSRNADRVRLSAGCLVIVPRVHDSERGIWNRTATMQRTLGQRRALFEPQRTQVGSPGDRTLQVVGGDLAAG